MALLDIDRRPFAIGFEGASLLDVAAFGRSPALWQLRDLGALDRYTCTEFVREEPS